MDGHLSALQQPQSRGQEVTRTGQRLSESAIFRLALRQHMGNFHSFSLAAATRILACPVLGLRILPHLISPHPRGPGLPNVPTVSMITDQTEPPLGVAEQNSPMRLSLPQTCSLSGFHFPCPGFSAQMETGLSRISAASSVKTARQWPSYVLYSKSHRCLGKCLTGQDLPSRPLKLGNHIKSNFKCNTDGKT